MNFLWHNPRTNASGDNSVTLKLTATRSRKLLRKIWWKSEIFEIFIKSLCISIQMMIGGGPDPKFVCGVLRNLIFDFAMPQTVANLFILIRNGRSRVMPDEIATRGLSSSLQWAKFGPKPENPPNPLISIEFHCILLILMDFASFIELPPTLET